MTREAQRSALRPSSYISTRQNAQTNPPPHLDPRLPVLLGHELLKIRKRPNRRPQDASARHEPPSERPKRLSPPEWRSGPRNTSSRTSYGPRDGAAAQGGSGMGEDGGGEGLGGGQCDESQQQGEARHGVRTPALDLGGQNEPL